MIYPRQDVIRTALGQEPADLIIRDCRLVNVASREIYPADIIIRAGRIAAVTGPGESADQEAARVIDAGGQYAAPGFIDPHVHLESSMVGVAEYASAVIPRGTTMIAADPHEIGNVLGIAGIRALFEDARRTPLRVKLRVPGRIPAVPDWMETSNARLDVADTRALFEWPEALCLAGDINPNLVLQADAEQLEKFDMADALGVLISGQSPGLTGRALSAFLAAGPEDSHVAGTIDEVIENTRAGMASVLALRPANRLGRDSFAELFRRVRELGLDTRLFQVCTDDIHANDLLAEGHLDHRLRTLIEAGFPAVEAIQFATINTAQGLRIAHHHGSITPGKVADVILMDDLERISVTTTIVAGDVLFDGNGYHGTRAPSAWPDWARQTLHVPRPLTREDLGIAAPGNATTARVQCLVGLTPDHPKILREIELSVDDGLIQPDTEGGVVSMAMIERHKASGEIGRGFTDIIALAQGAIACSVNHDAHNISVFGVNHDDMALAANRLVEIGGGYVIAEGGRIRAELAMPVAGLLSELPIEEVAAAFDAINIAARDHLGARGTDKQLLSLNFLALPNIPDYGFTNKGLVASDGRMTTVPVIID